jgi:protein-tyrosine phosphatase
MADPSKPIIFVCTANICRSPMAAELLRHALDAEPEPHRSIPVTSAGVSAVDGQPASPNSVEAMRKVGLSLSDHRSRHLTQTILNDALAVFCMTESHRDIMNVQYRELPKRIHLMREFMTDTSDHEIPDPFGGNLRTYESCRDSMVEAIPSLLKFIRTLKLPT